MKSAMKTTARPSLLFYYSTLPYYEGKKKRKVIIIKYVFHDFQVFAIHC